MSTKAIREALGVLRATENKGAPDVVYRALAEVEAIERAAVEWVVSDVGEVSDDASATLVSISDDVVSREEAP